VIRREDPKTRTLFTVHNVNRVLFDFHTDIQLKPLRLSLEGFNMKINMRRDFVIFFSKITKSATPQGGAFQFKLK